jgi:hypothetical protein
MPPAPQRGAPAVPALTATEPRAARLLPRGGARFLWLRGHTFERMLRWREDTRVLVSPNDQFALGSQERAAGAVLVSRRPWGSIRLAGPGAPFLITALVHPGEPWRTQTVAGAVGGPQHCPDILSGTNTRFPGVNSIGGHRCCRRFRRAHRDDATRLTPRLCSSAQCLPTPASTPRTLLSSESCLHPVGASVAEHRREKLSSLRISWRIPGLLAVSHRDDHVEMTACP